MELKDHLRAQLSARGGAQSLRPVPDGPRIERFDPTEMAQMLEHEANRARGVGHTMLRIDISFEDATALARFLRRGALLGA